jgi:hypothetical protein
MSEKVLKRRVVLLQWVDAQSFDVGLCFPDELPDEPVVAEIVGFLVRETKKNYFLAKELWENGMCKYVHIVPKRSVVKKRAVIV